jgi:hypothetical protein
MHQATLSLQAPKRENSGSLPFFSLLLDFDGGFFFFARPKDACCLPTLRAVGGAMGGFRCRLGWCLGPGAVFKTAAPYSGFFLMVVVFCGVSVSVRAPAFLVLLASWSPGLLVSWSPGFVVLVPAWRVSWALGRSTLAVCGDWCGWRRSFRGILSDLSPTTWAVSLAT